MTISTDTATASYTGNGVTQIFPVPFYFLVDTDLKVSKKVAATGVVSVLTLNSDYTVSDAGNQAGGSITTLAVPASGDQLFIERNVDAVQETSYPENGIFPAASHEKALDRLTMIVQQILSKLTFGLFRDPLANTYDVGGNTISNVADAVDPQDVPSLLQVQGLIVGGAAPALAGTNGASLVGYDNGGTLATLKQMLDVRPWVSVKEPRFGAKGDGSTDDYAAIAAAIACVSSAGGTLYFPPGTYCVSQPIVVSASNVMLEGAGGDWYHDAAAAASGTTIKYTGASSSVAVVQFASVAGASNPRLAGGGLRGFQIDGNFVANIGLEVRSWDAGLFDHLYIKNVLLDGILTGVVTTLGEARDTQYNMFRRIAMRLIDLGAASADGIYIDGDDSANTSFNTFEDISIAHHDGDAIGCACSDNNTFRRISTSRTGGGTGKGAKVFGSNNPLRAANSNTFDCVSLSAGITVYGTETFTTPSYNTTIRGYDMANSNPTPTIGTGTRCRVDDTAGRVVGVRSFGVGQGGNNLCGQASFGVGTPSLTISFPTAEPDTNYAVLVTAEGSNPGQLWITSKTTSGFTISLSGSTAGSGKFTWMVVRT